MNPNKTVAEALRAGVASLKEHQVESSSLDAQLLLMEVTQLSKVQLYTQDHRVLTPEEWEKYVELLQQRGNGRPLQYIVGRCEFMGLEFLVNESVLVPRPDTEILVETILEFAKKKHLVTLLDMGTGSGCIPISLEKYGKFSTIGVDISEKALKVAQKNGEKHGCLVRWILSDLFQNVPDTLYGTLDALVSNPPYIATKEIETLMPEVREFEPRNALDGGTDGLSFYRSILAEGTALLKKDGWIFFEIGYDQGKAVSELLAQYGYSDIEVRQDLAGLDRVVLARKGERKER